MFQQLIQQITRLLLVSVTLVQLLLTINIFIVQYLAYHTMQ